MQADDRPDLGSPFADGDEPRMLGDLVFRPNRRPWQLGDGLALELADRGFDVELDAAGNLIAAWGDGARSTALVGHLDTAVGAIPVRCEGDVLYGRGAVDAKGPLLAALLAVMRQPRDSPHRYVVCGAVEEETTSRGAHHLAQTLPRPDELIVLEPSGWDGITVGYKGSVRLRWSRVQEAGHGAGPAISAADHAFAFVAALREHARRVTADRSMFERLDIRVIACQAHSDGITDRAHLDVGLRVPPNCDIDSLLDAVHDHAGGGDVQIVNVDAAVRTARTSPLARRFARAIRHRHGVPRFKLKTGTSDLNVLDPVWRCPAVAYGPGDSRLDHTPGERLAIAELLEAVEVLDAVLRAS